MLNKSDHHIYTAHHSKVTIYISDGFYADYLQKISRQNTDDSGISSSCSSIEEDLRSQLSRKEEELEILRETMAQNETAIMGVNEENKQLWQKELEQQRGEFVKQFEKPGATVLQDGTADSVPPTEAAAGK